MASSGSTWKSESVAAAMAPMTQAPPTQHLHSDDLDIKPGIAELIREEERVSPQPTPSHFSLKSFLFFFLCFHLNVTHSSPISIATRREWPESVTSI